MASNYSTTAQVVVSVNGRQAKQMLSSLEKDAKRLEQQISKAAGVGDKAKVKQLERQLNNLKKVMDQLKGSTNSVEQTLSRLDRATPKELNRALQQLQNQLNNTQRGTAQFKALQKQIKAVKTEIQQCNAAMATQRSTLSRLNVWFNNTATSIMAVTAALGAFIAAGRRAVNAYAEMDEQMANTRKYTRMTAEQVKELNDIFLNMDTRISRQQLNLLAQEGGRLGFNTVQTVKEYVEAAGIINVALVDLGEGATQSIAKISNIFGQQELYGVRDAMLKVGSTVNHLSQNCTASKPFIVEFTNRLAGIGSTAKMTIPQIMAFAATLDAHGQKVEMSATAVSRLILKLYQQPAQIAKAVGIHTDYLKKVLANDTSEAVMLFLEKLSKMGGKNALGALAPLFDELGMDGIRLAQVLANLSSHLDFLKWQMGEANKAYKEGVSATNEYNIFNNTVTASISKAKARVHELAVSLGEKLYPVMRHIYTSSSAFLRMLNHIVNFVIDNRVAIVSLASAVTAYNLVLLAHNSKVAIATAATKAWGIAVAWGRNVMTVFNLGVAALTNSVQYFTNGLQVNYAMQQRWRNALAAMKFAHWTGLVMALAGAIVYLSNRTDEYTKKMRETVSRANDVEKATLDEIKAMDRLFGSIEGAKKGSEDYQRAKDAIINKYGKYLQGLITEKGEILDLEKAYDRLTEAVRRSMLQRGLAAAQEKLDSQFNDSLIEDTNELRMSLEKFGVEAREASRIAMSVMQSFAAGENPSDDILMQIGQASENIFASAGAAWTWLKAGFGAGKGTPLDIVRNMMKHLTTYNDSRSSLDTMHDNSSPWANVETGEIVRRVNALTDAIDDLQRRATEAAKKGEQPPAMVVAYEVQVNTDADGNPVMATQTWNINAAYDKLEAMQKELGLRGVKLNAKGQPVVEGDISDVPGTGEDSPKTKAQSDKDRFKNEDNWRAMREAYAMISKALGMKQDDKTMEMKRYGAHDYELEMTDIEATYYKKILDRDDLSYIERLQYRAKFDDAMLRKLREFSEVTEELELEHYAKIRSEEAKALLEGQTTTEKYNAAIEFEELQHLERLAEIYKRGAYARVDDWEKKNAERIKQLQQDDSEEAKKEMEKLLESKPGRDEELWEKYRQTYEKFSQLAAKLREKRTSELDEAMKKEKEPIDELMRRFFGDTRLQKIASLRSQLFDLERAHYNAIEATPDDKARDEVNARYERQRKKIQKEISDLEKGKYLTDDDASKSSDPVVKFMESDPGKAIIQSYATVVQGVSDIFSKVTDVIKAELDMQTAAIEKRYDAELSRAEGNAYRIKAIEQKKEKELADAKTKANRKMFAMQVIQAIAQTATNALNAYGSAAAIPVVGHIMAPIAAAMAVAAGMVQVAAIKKQQQASEAQGYAEGGFTKPGKKYEPAGVVHAGEWVASQELVNSPVARPLIDALEYAQRTNTVGRLSAADVSRTLTAPMVIAHGARASAQSAQMQTLTDRELTAVISRLSDRLDEPFVTVTTIDGDYGVRTKWREYDRYIANKSPKK